MDNFFYADLSHNFSAWQNQATPQSQLVSNGQMGYDFAGLDGPNGIARQPARYTMAGQPLAPNGQYFGSQPGRDLLAELLQEKQMVQQLQQQLLECQQQLQQCQAQAQQLQQSLAQAQQLPPAQPQQEQQQLLSEQEADALRERSLWVNDSVTRMYLRDWGRLINGGELGLPFEKLDTSMPFGGRLIKEVIASFQQGRLPEPRDVLLLTMCSDKGEIARDMAARPGQLAEDQVVDLVNAITHSVVHGTPAWRGQLWAFLRRQSAVTLVRPGKRLALQDEPAIAGLEAIDGGDVEAIVVEADVVDLVGESDQLEDQLEDQPAPGPPAEEARASSSHGVEGEEMVPAPSMQDMLAVPDPEDWEMGQELFLPEPPALENALLHDGSQGHDGTGEGSSWLAAPNGDLFLEPLMAPDMGLTHWAGSSSQELPAPVAATAAATALENGADLGVSPGTVAPAQLSLTPPTPSSSQSWVQELFGEEVGEEVEAGESSDQPDQNQDLERDMLAAFQELDEEMEKAAA